MTRQKRIDQLKTQTKCALAELDKLIAEGAPDYIKERVADQINQLQSQIDSLGNFDA